MLGATLRITLHEVFTKLCSRPFFFRYHVASADSSSAIVCVRVAETNKKFSFGKFMKIGLAMCKCEINLNNYTTTFMFAEMLDTGHILPFSCVVSFRRTKLVYKYRTTSSFFAFFIFISRHQWRIRELYVGTAFDSDIAAKVLSQKKIAANDCDIFWAVPLCSDA